MTSGHCCMRFCFVIFDVYIDAGNKNICDALRDLVPFVQFKKRK